MAHTVDQTFMNELALYGAFEVRACFNCGNCTAACALTDGEVVFPRKFIRYAQLGMKDRFTASKEMWLCFSCADCAATCPRQAEPAQFMAAARRYVISRYDPTTLARRLYTSNLFAVSFLVLAAAALALVMLAGYGSINTEAVSFGELINVHYIHYTGQTVMILAAVISGMALVSMVKSLNRANDTTVQTARVLQEEGPVKLGFWHPLKCALREAAAQTRFEQCNAGPSSWYLRQRFVHLSIMWGFLGLLAATALDLIFKSPFSAVPLYYPVRVLGTAAGLLVLYGTSVTLIQRLRKQDKYVAHSLFSDWLFLGLMWGVTATGFVVEIAVYLPSGPTWAYVVFLVHMVGAMMLVLLLPFTKFAHAVLRPVALFIHELRSPTLLRR